MLEQVFFRLLRMGVSAAWLSIAVMVLRALMKSAPRRIVLLLWALVALRLICPFSIEWRLSLVPRPEALVHSVQTAAPAAAPTTARHASVLGWVWLSGMAAMLLWGLWSDLRLRRRVRVSLPQGENVRLCDAIAAPFVLGVLRPQIYLPSAIDPAAAPYVLAHERAHIVRRDHWWKPLGWLLLSVYWFHPLLWLSYALFCRDLEFACDERVSSMLDRAGRAAYSDALLRCSVRRGALSSPVAFGETGVKMRVRAILRYRRPALRAVLLSVLSIAVVGALFLTERPAAALQLPEALMSETAPDREDDWTISPVQQIASAPETTANPAPTPTPQAAVRSVPEPAADTDTAPPAAAQIIPSEPVYVPDSEPTEPPAEPAGIDVVDSGGF